jgi:cysteine desulfurase
MYLDHAATTTLRPEAGAALDEALERFDRNASGIHSEARRAKNALEEARERAAVLVGAHRPHDIIFVGSGTEADNLAVMGGAFASDRRRVVVSPIEHKAVLGSAHALERFGFTVDELGVTPDGVVIVPAGGVANVANVALVSVMLVNNEIGTIQPVADLASDIKAADSDVLIHTDAVQAFNSEDATLTSTGVDLLSLASHKVGGPKGVGLLALAPGVQVDPIIHGGGQEAGRRAGTYNVAGVLAMVAAMEESHGDRAGFGSRTSHERDTFEAAIISAVPTASVTAAASERVPHISHIRFPGVLAETLLIRLDQAGLSASAGSACQSGAVEPSHVLAAMGFTTDNSAECVRFSFGWDTPPGTGVAAAATVLNVLGVG